MKEDLGIKVVDKDKVYWENLKTNIENQLEEAKNSIIVNEHILLLVKKKLK